MNKDKNVLIIFPNISYHTPAAANTWGKNLARAFSVAGFAATVLYIGPRREKKWVDKYNVSYSTITLYDSCFMRIPKLKSFVFPLLFTKYIDKYINKHKIDYNTIVPLEGPYNISRESFKVKVVKDVGATYLFSILEHPKRNTQTNTESEFEDYMKATVNLYDIVMPITTYVRNIYIKYGRTKPIFLNPIIVNLSQFREPTINAKSSISCFLYSGNICRNEEMNILFREFAIVHKEYPKTLLMVVGGGNTRRETRALIRTYKSVICKLGINNSVVFSGKLAHDKVLECYDKADAFLLPRPFREYSQAGFPTKLGEYLATGKPVIAYSTGDIPLYLDDGISAYLVSDDRVGNFAKRVKDAISDPLAYEIGIRGAQVARSSFSIEATAERISSFFRTYFEC